MMTERIPVEKVSFIFSLSLTNRGQRPHSVLIVSFFYSPDTLPFYNASNKLVVMLIICSSGPLSYRFLKGICKIFLVL